MWKYLVDLPETPLGTSSGKYSDLEELMPVLIWSLSPPALEETPPEDSLVLRELKKITQTANSPKAGHLYLMQNRETGLLIRIF